MAFLYINSKGFPHRKHSYSAGNDFDQSPLKYKLRRIQGWREKNDKARFEFGKALEEAIQFHHDHNGEGAVQDFIRRWNVYKDRPLSFTKTEKDWENLYYVGVDMIRLYIIRQPSLPIPLGGQSVFQTECSKEVFPGDPNYGEIEHAGKLDIVCFVDPHHPMLPKIDWKPEYGKFRELIVDIKTSAVNFPEQPGIAAFDKQLRCYSWLRGSRDVSLLWFVKTGRTLKKNSSVTLLVDAGYFKAGDEAVVAKVENGEVWLLKNDFMVEQMAIAQGKKEDGKTEQTKVAKATGLAWLKTNGVCVADIDITRQRLQFNAGRVSAESADGAGSIAARQITQIVNSWKANDWPNTFGIRFPHDDRQDSYFRAFVLGDEQLKQTGFERATEESFDDLFADDAETGEQE